ncbi:succinylglutamate desuccinylase/aspartoacylase family protein [Sulfitobacter sp. SK011]|uniref:succinylglutamate desuccinylase/aspartoacylase domain-containing protein n=1 Tax=Sulfitobacter sp. SK011 TaxID=1389004 RepID=UPI000E0AC8B0|nr:succinylglutamate desuccinylase/aspartoacylase family protein [Sulfitobacter sp. SK011]AXI41445.1 peptidase M14 [Sulfitobacter sp. SK011]
METERITLKSDTPGQELALSVFQFVGSNDGPAVYIQAALHSHEMPGVAALDQLMPRLVAAENEARLAGSITLVPHANPIGLAQAVYGETLGRFDANTRVNFNRSFPTDIATELTGKPAAECLKATLLTLAERADVVLDLHCDDEGPVYLYISEGQLDEGLRLARAMQAAVILTDAADDPISFDLAVGARWAVESRNADDRFAATIELRGMMDVTPDFAKQDADGLYRYLVDIGTVIDDLPAIDSVDPTMGAVDDAVLISTAEPGAILYDVLIGDWVTKGQRLAVILSEPGSAHHEILSPFDGQVMTRRDRRFARRGDDVIKVLRHPLP